MAIFLPIVVVLATLSPSLSASGEKTFVERAGTAYSSRPYSSVLTVSNGEQFGNWTWPEMCPDTFYAVGFSLRVKTMCNMCLQFTDCEFERVWLDYFSVLESIQLCIEVTHTTIWVNFMLACVCLLSFRWNLNNMLWMTLPSMAFASFVPKPRTGASFIQSSLTLDSKITL